MADIESNRPYRSCVTKAETDGIGIKVAEVFESNPIEDISAVIKRGEAQPFLDRQGNPEFGVQDEQFRSSGRDLDQSAARGIRRISARGHDLLRPGAVQRKSTQCASAAREKLLADRDMAAG